MKVSVITITRNDKDGLRRTIESVKSQDYDDIEHIIVDADSSDGTKDLLANASGITYVSEPDGGRYDGMNKGVRMSTGDVVWFMHSSDQFADDRTVSYVARQIGEHTSSFTWGYGLSAIVKDGTAIGIGGQVPFDLSRFLLGGKIVPHQAAVFSRSGFNALGGYRTNFGLAADQEFMARCAIKSAPLVWPRVLCIFDGHGAGSTRGLREHFKDMGRTRRNNGIVISANHITDSAISSYLMAFIKLRRAAKRVTNAMNAKGTANV